MHTTPQIEIAVILPSINQLSAARSITALRQKVKTLQESLSTRSSRAIVGTSGGTIRLDFLEGELHQIASSQTIERAKYYVKRLRKSLTVSRTSRFNDLNLNRWKEYTSILTDSLWTLDKRDASGSHAAWYWGNFIPQIPHQLMLRYTKHNEWVLDPFAGSGTTLIEAQRLGRNCLGVELQPAIARKARSVLSKEPLLHPGLTSAIEVGDSRTIDFRKLLRSHGIRSVQLAILHPPYHNIIRFSSKRDDLSNYRSVDRFVDAFGGVVKNVGTVLDAGRFLALVIGDKYEKGSWIPLGFLLMQRVTELGFSLKSIVVKNFDETTGKRSQKELWRYRALAGGFYVFKHEYIFIFRKNL